MDIDEKHNIKQRGIDGRCGMIDGCSRLVGWTMNESMDRHRYSNRDGLMDVIKRNIVETEDGLDQHYGSKDRLTNILFMSESGRMRTYCSSYIKCPSVGITHYQKNDRILVSFELCSDLGSFVIEAQHTWLDRDLLGIRIQHGFRPTGRIIRHRCIDTATMVWLESKFVTWIHNQYSSYAWWSHY